jgi:endonuclease/exonuclease/phosphatase (EEP) superfamily protein YafD
MARLRRTLRRWRTPLTVAAVFTLLSTLGGWPNWPDSSHGECRLTTLPEPEIRRTGLPPQFDVLSWNIQKGSQPDWETDLRKLAADRELVLLQEAVTTLPLAAQLPPEMHRSFAPGYRSGALQSGVMTLSSAAPSDECQFSASEPWLGTPKATSITRHPMAGSSEQLLLINLHGVNFAIGVEDLQRQIEALGQLIDAHRGPVILAGDVNTWSAPRQALVDTFSNRHRLKPAVFDPDLRSRPTGYPLDHVYVRDLDIISARAAAVDSSDHNPLLLTLRHRAHGEEDTQARPGLAEKAQDTSVAGKR